MGVDLYVDLSLLSQLRAEDGGSTYMWLSLYAVIYGKRKRFHDMKFLL